MTVWGDLWAVCMDCTPICDTFPSKGRRVSSQILLSNIAFIPLCPDGLDGCADVVPCCVVLGVISFFLFSVGSYVWSEGSSWVISVAVWAFVFTTYCAPAASIILIPSWSAFSRIPRIPLCSVSAIFTTCYARIFSYPSLHISQCRNRYASRVTFPSPIRPRLARPPLIVILPLFHPPPRAHPPFHTPVCTSAVIDMLYHTDSLTSILTPT